MEKIDFLRHQLEGHLKKTHFLLRIFNEKWQMVIDQWQIGWLEEDINRGFAKEDFFNLPEWKMPNILRSTLPKAGEGLGVKGSARNARCLQELEIVVNTGQALHQRKAHDEWYKHILRGYQYACGGDKKTRPRETQPSRPGEGFEWDQRVLRNVPLWSSA